MHKSIQKPYWHLCKNKPSQQDLLPKTFTKVCAQGADGSDIPAGYVTGPVDCDRLQKKGSVQGGGWHRTMLSDSPSWLLVFAPVAWALLYALHPTPKLHCIHLLPVLSPSLHKQTPSDRQTKPPTVHLLEDLNMSEAHSFSVKVINSLCNHPPNITTRSFQLLLFLFMTRTPWSWLASCQDQFGSWRTWVYSVWRKKAWERKKDSLWRV